VIRKLPALLIAFAMIAPAAAARAASSELTLGAHSMARCLYDKHRKDALAMLAATAAAEAGRLHNRLVSMRPCSEMTVEIPSSGEVAIQPPRENLRGMVAEAALRDVPGAGELGPLETPPPSARDWFAATGREAAVDAMAVCMADRHPIGIRKLLAAAPTSGEESGVLQALAAVLPQCLPQGVTLKANREAFRAALAEAFYHRATSPLLAAK
jgi:hypothetical protein